MEFETKGLLKEKIMIFVYEFLGTFLLVQAVNYSQGTAIYIGLTLYMNILLFESVCGAHFNPAVTVGVFFMELKHWKRNILWLVLYLVAQFSGAFVGCLFSYSTIPEADLPILHRGVYGDDINIKPHSDYGVFMVELVYTMMFVLVVTYQKYDPAMLTPGSFLDAVACGLALFVSVQCASKISGGCINPAVGFALTVCASMDDIKKSKESDMGLEDDLWIYLVAPLLGGVIASLFYRFVHVPVKSATNPQVQAVLDD
jgi:glycerol uptake facilitator-like aquaporin